MPGTGVVPNWVKFDGKSATAPSPSTTSARPRYRARVPIVTARDGRPSLVTSRPLTRPHTAPRTITVGMIASIVHPAFHSSPITALDRPSTDATDRSISPATTTSVSGSAISATSPMSSPR